MRNIFLIVKNNLYRLKRDKASLIMIVFILPIVIGCGIYFSRDIEMKGVIAVSGIEKSEQINIEKALGGSENISFEFLDGEISKTKLIRGEYIAGIKFLENGKVEVSEFSNKEAARQIEAMIKGEEYVSDILAVSTVSKIVGFLAMFLCFCALTIVDPFLSDRENKVYSRVLTANISYYEYTLGQIFYLIITLAIPSMIVSFAITSIFNIDINMGTGMFLLVVFITGLFSSSFAILASNLFKVKMQVAINGSIIVMITSLLSGCVINIEGGNKFIEGIRGLLPQKRLIDFANDLNNIDLIFVIGFIVIALIMSVYIGNKDYEKGVFL